MDEIIKTESEEQAEAMPEELAEELEEEVSEESAEEAAEMPEKQKKCIFCFFKKKSKVCANAVTLVANILLIALFLVSAISLFGDSSDVLSYVGLLIGYLIAGVLMLLPGYMVSGMVRKGGIKFAKGCWAIIISNLFLLFMLAMTSTTSAYEIDAAVIIMLVIMYFSDMYVAACLILRRTKFFESAAKKVLTIIGTLASAGLLVFLVISIGKTIIESLSSFTAVFLADSIFAVISYFSYVMFIFAGMLTLYVKDYQK